jgi:hypothetical protein
VAGTDSELPNVKTAAGLLAGTVTERTPASRTPGRSRRRRREAPVRAWIVIGIWVGKPAGVLERTSRDRTR